MEADHQSNSQETQALLSETRQSWQPSLRSDSKRRMKRKPRRSSKKRQKKLQLNHHVLLIHQDWIVWANPSQKRPIPIPNLRSRQRKLVHRHADNSKNELSESKWGKRKQKRIRWSPKCLRLLTDRVRDQTWFWSTMRKERATWMMISDEAMWSSHVSWESGVQVVEETALKVVQSLTDCRLLLNNTMLLSKRRAKISETIVDSLPQALSKSLLTAN